MRSLLTRKAPPSPDIGENEAFGDYVERQLNQFTAEIAGLAQNLRALTSSDRVPHGGDEVFDYQIALNELLFGPPIDVQVVDDFDPGPEVLLATPQPDLGQHSNMMHQNQLNTMRDVQR